VVDAAHTGTLFFDEVGEIPLPVQPKLLRFLQEREYRPVGSTAVKRADVRIVAATNRDLRKEVAAGRFREDLYYRLNVLQLQIPPLRERKEDIPHLASFFLRRYVREFDKPSEGFSPRAIQRLSSHDYPGNVRELENVVQQALVAARHTVVTAEDIQVGDPAIIDQIAPTPLDPPPATTKPSGDDWIRVDCDLPYNEAKQRVTEAFERAYATRVLERHEGNVTRAASAAGLPRKSMARIMRRHNIVAGPDGSGGRPGRPRGQAE
jgi:transcriptional regulator with PAS, ATPase and Fis domain